MKQIEYRGQIDALVSKVREQQCEQCHHYDGVSCPVLAAHEQYAQNVKAPMGGHVDPIVMRSFSFLIEPGDEKITTASCSMFVP